MNNRKFNCDQLGFEPATNRPNLSFYPVELWGQNESILIFNQYVISFDNRI